MSLLTPRFNHNTTANLQPTFSTVAPIFLAPGRPRLALPKFTYRNRRLPGQFRGETRVKMVRMSILRLAVSVVVVFSIVNAPTCEARPSPLEKLDSADLTDLLDAPLDETFLQRNLQEATTAPTPAPPGDFSTSSPTFAERDNIISTAPTPAPVDATRENGSMAPTAAPPASGTGTAAPTPSEMDTAAPTPSRMGTATPTASGTGTAAPTA
ncbi:unnamed protein product, partial [Ascophyllum nodosum]